MGGVSARHVDAEAAWFVAEMFLAASAGRTLAATDPGIGNPMSADFDALGVRTGGYDFALDLVTEREGELAARAYIELVTAAHVEMTVMDMDVGVTNTTMRNLEQDFGAFRLRCHAVHDLQGLAVFDDGFGLHGGAS